MTRSFCITFRAPGGSEVIIVPFVYQWIDLRRRLLLSDSESLYFAPVLPTRIDVQVASGPGIMGNVAPIRDVAHCSEFPSPDDRAGAPGLVPRVLSRMSRYFLSCEQALNAFKLCNP